MIATIKALMSTSAAWACLPAFLGGAIWGHIMTTNKKRDWLIVPLLLCVLGALAIFLFSIGEYYS